MNMNMDFDINDCLHVVSPLTNKHRYSTEQEKQIELRAYKREAKKIVRDFKYNIIMPDIFNKIKQADTCDKVANLLTRCRLAS